MSEPRTICAHCRRPQAVCYCAHLVPQPARTRVVFLQHPREAKVPIGTARMAHLMLPNSEIYKGVSFDALPAVQALAADPTAALLFPGPGAQLPGQLAPGAVQTLVVVDGTWQQARKVLKENPLLLRLPRVGIAPARPGNYRIRREPAADCLATIEAVAEALGALEGEPERFAGMLAAFTYMVDRQLERTAARQGLPRRWIGKTTQADADARWASLLARALLVQVEVNAHAREEGVPGPPELLHLLAQRVATGERFVAVVAPRRPLAKNAPYHLGLDEARLRAGEPMAAALARFRAFVRDSDVPCGWGHYARDQLATEGIALPEWIDLKVPVARKLRQGPGSPTRALTQLGVAAALGPIEDGRAGRTVAELVQIIAALRAAWDRSAQPG